MRRGRRERERERRVRFSLGTDKINIITDANQPIASSDPLPLIAARIVEMWV